MAVTKRLYFFDNLRVALTVLLIAHHVGQAYGPTGGEWPIQEAARASLLGPFFTVNRSFFMSLFFMISGYFSAISCDQKGPYAFLRSRLLRLGVPVVLWALIVAVPFQIFFVRAPNGGLGSPWPLDVGHLWFLEHLLILSAVYAFWRVLRRGHTPTPPEQTRPPRSWAILLFALGIAVASGLSRIWKPIDEWSYLLGFVKVAFADVPRDVAFFFVGILTFRRGWLSSFDTKAGYAWLAVGVGGAALWHAYDPWLYGLLHPSSTAHEVFRLLWEGALVCGMCIGLTVLFREKLDMGDPVSRELAKGQYAAYIFHLPIVVLIQIPFMGFALPPLVKFFLVCLVSVPVTFLFSVWVRKPLRL